LCQRTLSSGRTMALTPKILNAGLPETTPNPFRHGRPLFPQVGEPCRVVRLDGRLQVCDGGVGCELGDLDVAIPILKRGARLLLLLPSGILCALAERLGATRPPLSSAFSVGRAGLEPATDGL
jgi:hypothetical protein